MNIKKIFEIKNIFRILGIIIIIIPLIVKKDFYQTNEILFFIFEIISIVGTILLFIKKSNLKKIHIIIICIYILVSLLLPIHTVHITRTPSGHDSYLVGIELLGVKKINFYGMDITKLINFFLITYKSENYLTFFMFTMSLLIILIFSYLCLFSYYCCLVY